jgi:hypothetical protein
MFKTLPLLRQPSGRIRWPSTIEGNQAEIVPETGRFKNLGIGHIRQGERRGIFC